jgi:hypothetical protein
MLIKKINYKNPKANVLPALVVYNKTVKYEINPVAFSGILLKAYLL